MDSSNGEQPSEKIKTDLSNSLSSKSGMSLSFLARSDENFSGSQKGGSQDANDLQNGSKQGISLTASTSMPNLSELVNEGAPDVTFWQDLDMQLDFFDPDLIEQSPKKVLIPVPEPVNVGVADEKFGSTGTTKKRLPPKLISLDPQHFYQAADKPERSVPSGSSSSKATKSSSISSGSRMDVSIGSERGFRNVNSMSIDSRDTMAELAQRIEPVGHDDIEFAPLDLTLSEELHLHLSSSYSMSVDERLVKYASTNTTPHSTLKTFDYPDSFSMSSWSQHTISQDVFAHHKAGHMDTSLEHVLEGDLWNAPSVELDLLDLHDGLAPPPTITANHSRHPAHQTNSAHHSSQHSQHPPQHPNSHHNSHHNMSLAQQNYAQMHPPAPPLPKPSPGPRGPRPPTKGNKNKAGAERVSIGETAAEDTIIEEKSPKSPKSARKSTQSSPASLPVDMPDSLLEPQQAPLQVHISPRQSPQMPHQQMGVPAMYSFPTAFQQSHAGNLAIHTNSPASPLHNNATLSPTQYLSPQLAPLFDPVSGVVYYPQIPPGVTLGVDPTGAFFGQMQSHQAAPGVSQRVAASFRLQASGFPVSSNGSPVSSDAGAGSGFDSISATMLHNGSGSTSNTVTPTGAQLKGKDKKDKNRGNYRCGRCGKPKVNHVCTFVDAVTVSQAVQAKGVILNPHTMQPFNGDRVLTVNTQRKSIQVPEEDDKSFESFGMKATSGSFTLGSKTPVTAAGAAAMESLSTKSGVTDLLYRSSSNLSESLLARTNSNLTGESLLLRTNSGGSDIFDSLSRSVDEAFSPRELNLGPRSPGSARPSMVFSQPINQSQGQTQPGAERNLAQSQLSCESEDAFFPTAYPPKTGVISNHNSNVNEAENYSSANGDTPVEVTTESSATTAEGAGSVPKPRSTLGSMFSSEGLGKFFQF